jgi:hypothetical protein
VRYLLQRVVHNDLQWKAPSKGRRGSSIDEGYVKEHGFAHEDWNFDSSTANGYVYGYFYFRPKDVAEKFSVAFATYDKGGQWNLAGYYENVSYEEEGAPFSTELLRQRARHLKLLQQSGDLGGQYEGRSLVGIAKRLREEAQFYRWKLRLADAHGLSSAVPIPASLMPENASRYFTRPSNLTERAFESLKKLARNVGNRKVHDDYDAGGEVEFPEGKRLQGIHFRRERSKKLVRLVKAAFKKKNGHLFCEACAFDFEHVYGQPGVNFIEAHHNIAVSLLLPNSRTKLSDMSLVCSNCHRMLHRSRPWRTVQQLRSLINRSRAKGL